MFFSDNEKCKRNGRAKTSDIRSSSLHLVERFRNGRLKLKSVRSGNSARIRCIFHENLPGSD